MPGLFPAASANQAGLPGFEVLGMPLEWLGRCWRDLRELAVLAVLRLVAGWLGWLGRLGWLGFVARIVYESTYSKDCIEKIERGKKALQRLHSKDFVGKLL